MKFKKFVAPLISGALIVCFASLVFADTIRLKDGTVIRGQVVGFRDQQFTVLIGNGARGGRRSRIMLLMEDVESIEFDGTSTSAGSNDVNNSSGIITGNTTAPVTQSGANDSGGYTSINPPADATTNNSPSPANNTSARTPNASPRFFQARARVRADNTTNGWTNSGLVVQRGQRLRITATGRVSLGQGRFSTPAGVSTLPDRDKLMRDEATGALIAVIGDNNDDFIFVGNRREFVAQRDGVLFLGVNEGNLTDNSGAYDVTIEAETLNANNAAPAVLP